MWERNDEICYPDFYIAPALNLELEKDGVKL
ncbi:Uncharacterised protein [Staphylococcus piscifermentans]|nr:Uncharacterised protein [Staphylococcus piscifermentans]